MEVGADASDVRTIVREMITHEDKLRNERFGWLLTLDGFLFTALGFAWGSKDAGRLVGVLALLGVVIALSSLAAMHISDKALEGLRQWADEHVEGAPIVGLTNQDLAVWAKVLQPWKSIPWALLVVWPLVFLLRVV